MGNPNSGMCIRMNFMSSLKRPQYNKCDHTCLLVFLRTLTSRKCLGGHDLEKEYHDIYLRFYKR